MKTNYIEKTLKNLLVCQCKAQNVTATICRCQLSLTANYDVIDLFFRELIWLSSDVVG